MNLEKCLRDVENGMSTQEHADWLRQRENQRATEALRFYDLRHSAYDWAKLWKRAAKRSRNRHLFWYKSYSGQASEAQQKRDALQTEIESLQAKNETLEALLDKHCDAGWESVDEKKALQAELKACNDRRCQTCALWEADKLADDDPAHSASIGFCPVYDSCRSSNELCSIWTGENND